MILGGFHEARGVLFLQSSLGGDPLAQVAEVVPLKKMRQLGRYQLISQLRNTTNTGYRLVAREHLRIRAELSCRFFYSVLGECRKMCLGDVINCNVVR